MRFILSEDQAALRDNLRSFLDKHLDSAGSPPAAGPQGHDAALWSRMVDELGITAVGMPEEYGGTGENFVDVAVVLDELGRALAPVPFFSSSVLTARVLRESGRTNQTAGWLAALARGELTATAALVEGSGDWAFQQLSTTARRRRDGWVLHGEKCFVLDGDTAGLLLVLAYTETGPTLFAVHPGEGVEVAPANTLDPTRSMSTVLLDAAPGMPVGPEGSALAVLERALPVAAIGLSCEQVGGATRCMDMTVEYAKTRVQFGRPIGSFQAIKHMLVERLVDNESARSAAYYAAWAVDNLPADVPSLGSLCASTAADAYADVAKTAVQVHGGIGFTWEHRAHLYLKRAMSTNALLGSPSTHRERIASYVLDNMTEKEP